MSRQTDIQLRAKGAGQKTLAEIQALGVSLWAIGSPTPRENYKSPWDKVGNETWHQLLKALESADSSVVALIQNSANVESPHLNYTSCAKELIQKSRAIHQILTDIRGLALATDNFSPVEVVKEPPAEPKNVLPGIPLVYDTL